MHARLATFALLLSACTASSGVDAGVDAGIDASPTDDAGATDAGTDAGHDGGPSLVVGGARPARVIPPDGADGSPSPLVILLHGYGASGLVQDAVLGFSHYTRAHGIYFIAPDGVLGTNGLRAWNATDACCGDHTVDDVAYLRGLVAETSSRFPIDPTRIYFAGHSNGGFMSYRMACDDSAEVSAIASLAGATWLDESHCNPTDEVSVLQIHGTIDDTVQYDGTAFFPSARQSVERFATRAGCDLSMAMPGPPRDLVSDLDGSETTTLTWTAGCSPGTDMALWTMVGAGHVPAVTDDFAQQTIEWLLTHHR